MTQVYFQNQNDEEIVQPQRPVEFTSISQVLEMNIVTYAPGPTPADKGLKNILDAAKKRKSLKRSREFDELAIKASALHGVKPVSAKKWAARLANSFNRADD